MSDFQYIKTWMPDRAKLGTELIEQSCDFDTKSLMYRYRCFFWIAVSILVLQWYQAASLSYQSLYWVYWSNTTVLTIILKFYRGWEQFKARFRDITGGAKSFWSRTLDTCFAAIGHVLMSWFSKRTHRFLIMQCVRCGRHLTHMNKLPQQVLW